MSTQTEHEVAVFETENGDNVILVWIDDEDVEAFEGVYTEDEWQTSIENHPFIKERNLPVVIAFADEDGDPRLYGPKVFVEQLVEFDWDSIEWDHTITLTWGTDVEDEDEDDEDEDDEDEDDEDEDDEDEDDEDEDEDEDDEDEEEG